MSDPNTAAEALKQAKAKLIELKLMSLETIYDSPEKAQCRLAVMSLTGRVLNRFFPTASSSEVSKASYLYTVAANTK